MEEQKDKIEMPEENVGKKKKVKKRKSRIVAFFSDFKKFISKGNIIDLAVAVVIGAAFTKIVNSLVSDIIMPLIGLIVGKNNIADMKWQITPELSLNWGMFVMAIIDFLIIAFVIFIVLRILIKSQQEFGKIKKLRKKDGEPIEEEPAQIAEEPTPVESTEDILREIRDLLKSQQPAVNQTIIEEIKEEIKEENE